MPTSRLIHIRRKLLGWYTRNRRDLPWRRTRDPYAIWIAETMLQQTQVKTVLPYYARFMGAFPNIESLDRASEEKVLALWSGLGYYRRAENLKKAARKILRNHRGKLPQEFSALCTLPGIGSYTAGALMSIAFNQPFPALDGNARRLLTRIFNVKNEKDLNSIAKQLVSPSHPGHFNQAVMDLGSTICLARNPRCPSCPLTRFCAAKKSARFDYRRPSAKRQIIDIDWPVALIEKDGKILLHRRPRGGLLGGLWELPGGERKKRESLKAALSRHLNGLGKQVKVHSRIGEIRHSITHHKIRAPLFTFVLSNHKKPRLPRGNWRWFSPSALGRYPLSSLSLKAIKHLTRFQKRRDMSSE